MLVELVIVSAFLVLVVAAFSLDIWYSDAPYRRRRQEQKHNE